MTITLVMMLPKVCCCFFLLVYRCRLHTHLNTKLIGIFAALPGEYVDMVKAGIVDPLKVIRTALIDAAR